MKLTSSSIALLFFLGIASANATDCSEFAKNITYEAFSLQTTYKVTPKMRAEISDSIYKSMSYPDEVSEIYGKIDAGLLYSVVILDGKTILKSYEVELNPYKSNCELKELRVNF